MGSMLNAHALIIGIAGYPGDLRLPSVEDPLSIERLLTDPTACGYPPPNVRRLDEVGATRDAIRRELSDLAARTDTDSIALVYFSGHGDRFDGEEVLIPVDVDPSSSKSALATSIPGREFTEAIAAIPARKVLVVLDCCRAGGVAALKGAPQAARTAGLTPALYERLAAGEGRVVFASSDANEFSAVIFGESVSLFTKHLLGGLRGGARASREGLICVFDLFEYLQEKVPAENPRQHPIFKAVIRENFPIAFHRGGTAPPDGFRYDAYISYADVEPDATWVRKTLEPRLEAAGVRFSDCYDSAVLGWPRVRNVEQGIIQARRTVVVLSDAYLDDEWAAFRTALAQTKGILNRTYPVVPIVISPPALGRLQLGLTSMEPLQFSRNRSDKPKFERLAQALKGPLPRDGH